MADEEKRNIELLNGDKVEETSSPSSNTDLQCKKRRTRTPSPSGTEAATNGQATGSNPHGFSIPASPPKFVTFEQLMSAANGIRNMSLAHEIVVDGDFKLEKRAPEPNSIESRVREVVHRAFWDLLQEEITQDPPAFERSLVLIEEIKEILLGLLMPQNVRLKAQVSEVLDLDLIKQKMENDAFDIHYYGDYVIGVMTRICAPLRDDSIASLKSQKEVVPLFKGILEVLELMKMDMANFTLQQMRPYLQQQSVEYERKKFQELLQTQEEHGTDGLQFTKLWLERSFDKLMKDEDDAAGGASIGSKVTPATVMNEAYLELLIWDDKNMFPEVLLMDQGRFLELRDKGRDLVLIASVLLVTFNTVGASIAGLQDLKSTLKDNITSIITQEKDYKKMTQCIADQVYKDVNERLVKHGFSVMTDETTKSLLGQITDVADENSSIPVLLRKRIHDFFLDSITSRHTTPMKVPPGFSTLPAELSQMLGKFLRLISHNRSVFGVHFANIIGPLVRKQPDLSPR